MNTRRSGNGRDFREGLTLLETVIAIVIGLVILAGVGTLVYRAVSTNKVSQAYTEASTIIRNVRNLYAGTAHTDDINTNVATYIDAGVIPKNMIRGSSAYNPWGGQVTFSGTSQSTITTLAWVVFHGVPKSACIELMLKMGQMKLSGYYTVTSGGTSTAPDLAWAETACQSASNTMEFRFNAR